MRPRQTGGYLWETNRPLTADPISGFPLAPKFADFPQTSVEAAGENLVPTILEKRAQIISQEERWKTRQPSVQLGR